MRNNRRRGRLLIWAALAGAMIVLVWRLLPEDRSLLAATTVRYPLHGKRFVAWLSNSEVVVLQYDKPAVNSASAIAHPYVVDITRLLWHAAPHVFRLYDLLDAADQV